MRVTTDLVLVGLFAFVAIALVVVLIVQTVKDALMIRRRDREDAARDAAVAVRIAEDLHWEGVSGAWYEFLNDYPVLGYDPEML